MSCASDQETRAPVAIKTVSKSILKPKLFDSLQSEIRIMKQLSHRHITKLIDIVVSVPKTLIEVFVAP